MRLALKEAGRGRARVSPNPAVGCVIVNNNNIIAKGYHKGFGGPHAEREALKKAGPAAEGATLYVTLEPCSHFGKTPPCTEAITESGINEVVAAMPDPNPANNGRGLKHLRKNGIKVISGVLRREAEELNRGFIERVKKKRPYITVKMAQSLDGKIATRTGDSKWVSSQGSREIVQRLRSRQDAIMVGVNTVIKDNPLLTVRRSHWHPVKVVVDSRMRTPTKANIFGKNSPAQVIIATTKKSNRVEREELKRQRCGYPAAQVEFRGSGPTSAYERTKQKRYSECAC